MSIEEILEAMDIELDKSKSVPLTRGKSLIDVEQFRDLIGQVRLNLPGEIKQAQALVNDRRVIINDAKAEAESLRRQRQMCIRDRYPRKLSQSRRRTGLTRYSPRRRQSPKRLKVRPTNMLKVCSAELTSFSPRTLPM
mgnify:CR=1 FL=1